MTQEQRLRLLQLNDVVGQVYGTENFGMFLYSIVKMQKPQVIVELGTGLAISAFWMAAALRENGEGHIWTVDNFSIFTRKQELVGELLGKLVDIDFFHGAEPDVKDYYESIAQALSLDSIVTFVCGEIEPHDPRHFDAYSFAEKQIDLVFSDFKHGPSDIVKLLAQLLPRMAPASSIFIHSASTAWNSYLLLENLCMHLNSGRVPQMMQKIASVDLHARIVNRKFTLVHLTDNRGSGQNSAAWIKIEPCDLIPHPLSAMRGMS